jgi:hypothetical protein
LGPMRLITTNGVLPMDGALPAQMRLMTMFFSCVAE